MSKFMDNVKTVTGYNTMHQAIMRDVFDAKILCEKIRADKLPTMQKLQSGGITAGAIAGVFLANTAGRSLAVAVTHPFSAVFVATCLTVGTALGVITYIENKLDQVIRASFFGNAAEIIKTGKISGAQDAASLGGAFVYNNWKMNNVDHLSLKDQNSSAFKDWQASVREENRDILIFAAESGLIRPATKRKVLNLYMAAALD